MGVKKFLDRAALRASSGMGAVGRMAALPYPAYRGLTLSNDMESLCMEIYNVDHGN